MKLKYFEIEILRLAWALVAPHTLHTPRDGPGFEHVCESMSKRTAGALYAHTHTAAAQPCVRVCVWVSQSK